DGRMFPVTDSSQTVVDCLLHAAHQRGVTIRLGAGVRDIVAREDAAQGSQFEISLRDGSKHHYDRILLATGSAGRGYRLAEALGHTIVPCVPSLFTFKISDPRLAGLSGLSFENVRLTLSTGVGKPLQQTGPLLITHWGLSGPAVLKLSAWDARKLHDCKYRAELEINLLPEQSTDTAYSRLISYREKNPRKQVHSGGPLKIPRRYWQRLVELQGLDAATTWSKLGNVAIRAIVTELTHGNFSVSGKDEFKEEFVTCGGVALPEVDFRTMQSKLCPGLYFAGEILDIDGVTGGFNFQNAWTTGWLAGKSMIA
ncbi:MAG: aminoacetone oxidase family FAD-binding enzyme, partial [bacterium]